MYFNGLCEVCCYLLYLYVCIFPFLTLRLNLIEAQLDEENVIHADSKIRTMTFLTSVERHERLLAFLFFNISTKFCCVCVLIQYL